MHTEEEEEEENLGAGGSTSARDVGEKGATSSQPGTGTSFASHPCPFFFFLKLYLGFASSPSRCPDPPSADQEDIDTVIEDVTKAAEAEADKIATEEAAKGVAEDAAKGPTGEPGKATAVEAGKGPAGKASKAATERRWLMTSLPPLLPLAPAGI